MHPLSHPPHISILNKSAKGIWQQMQTFVKILGTESTEIGTERLTEAK